MLYMQDIKGGIFKVMNHLGVCKKPAPIRLVFHDPPWAIFSFHSKKR